MLFTFVICLLYGVPIYVGIHILYWILRKTGFNKIGKKISLILNITLLVFLITAIGYNWYSRQHYTSFNFNEKYQIYIHAEEIESFMEAPTDFTLEVTNRKTHQKSKYNFHYGYGMGLNFFESFYTKNRIIIKGTDIHEYRFWIIDLDHNTIEQDFEYKDSLIKKIELMPDFRVKNRH